MSISAYTLSTMDGTPCSTAKRSKLKSRTSEIHPAQMHAHKTRTTTHLKSIEEDPFLLGHGQTDLGTGIFIDRAEFFVGDAFFCVEVRFEESTGLVVKLEFLPGTGDLRSVLIAFIVARHSPASSTGF
jgi:hypothetical protein